MIAWAPLVALYLAAAPGPGVATRAPELDGAIAGRVCEDLDGDGRCGPADPGVANVRVVLETGDEARTDLAGRYHLDRLEARTPDASEGGRLFFGRHRIAVDPRTVYGGATLSPRSVTVELPMGGLVEQDFTLRGPPREQASTVERAPRAPARGELTGPDRYRFLLTGKVAPTDQVLVAGKPATVDAEGVFRAWVDLVPGAQEEIFSVTSEDGTQHLFRQRLDAIPRPGGVLIVPRAPLPLAAVRLPARRGETVASGASSVRVEGAPGTVVSSPDGVARIGEGGVAQVPVTLAPGANEVPLTVTPPGGTPRHYPLSVKAAPKVFVVGLLDLVGTYDPARSGFRLTGRGAAHAEASAFGWDFSGELVLDDRDVHEADRLGLSLLGHPRFPERAQRALDPEQYPMEWNDDSLTLSPDVSGGRLRLTARNEALGLAQLGTYEATLGGGEVGVYRRELFGPALELAPKRWPVDVRLKAFDGSGLFDPTRGLATTPVHEELTSTGGSLFYLRSGAIAEGSEVVRVVSVDGVSRTPLAERHLVRGRDYEIDYAAGRILLARPLGLLVRGAFLRTLPPSHGLEPILVVDASRLLLVGSVAKPVGGEAEASFAGFSVSVGGVKERGAADYSLVRAGLTAPLGPVTLVAEAASSSGLHFLDGDFALSDDGGLSFQSPSLGAASGKALTLRLAGPGLDERGRVDLSFRRRTAGFTDAWHQDARGLHDLSLHLEQPVGPLQVALLADDFKGPDPRPALLDQELETRTVGGSVGGSIGRLSARVEARDTRLTAVTSEAPDALTGGRTSVGLDLGYRLTDRWSLTAGHLQALNRWGAGLGRVDDTFSSAGVRYEAGTTSGELRGGWGPALGFQLLGGGQLKRGDDTYYGGYSVDVDGPDFGTQRAVSGVSTRVGDGSTLFTEDVAAHDATALRLSRAVGVTESLAKGLTVTARFERGYRTPLDVYEPLAREGAGVGLEWVTPRVKAAVRAELRRDHGHTPSAPGVSVGVDRTQRVLGGAIQAQLLESLRASARFNYADTYASDVRAARFLEGTAGLTWRTDPGIWLLQYSVTRELSPPPRAFGERTLQVFSLLPAYTFGRFSLAAGAHLGLSEDGDARATVLSGSVRPGLRVWRGVEVALEAARRTADLGGGGLTALRGELGYRLGMHALIAAGYTFFGYSGLGLSPTPDGSQDRLYLRAELGI